MKADSLALFLDGKLDPRDLAKEIADEVERYRKGHDRKGSSIPISLTGSHGNIFVAPSSVIRLCDAMLKGLLTRWHIHYISDALSLSQARYASERVRDAVEELANPEIADEDLTEGDVRRIRESLTLD